MLRTRLFEKRRKRDGFYRQIFPREESEEWAFFHDRWEEEFEADAWALAVSVKSSSIPDDTLPVYLAVSAAFHVMSFMYRALHLLNFGLDYGHLPEKLLFQIYFLEGQSHLHPLTRLLQLRHAARQRANPMPENLDQYDSAVDSFFEMFWKPIAVWLMTCPTKQRPLDVWNEIVRFHHTAHDTWTRQQSHQGGE
jgi:hypothetical protein